MNKSILISLSLIVPIALLLLAALIIPLVLMRPKEIQFYRG